MEIHPNGYWLRLDGHYKDNPLALALATFFGFGTSVLDVGCGSGNYVRVLDNCGVECKGVDGNPHTPTLNGLVTIADVTQPLGLGQFDWVLSLEVGEHIPQHLCDAFLENLHSHCTKGIVLSWAIPGQGGHGHVNERSNEWVRKKIGAMGYTSDLVSEKILRKESTAPWFKDTIMVFRKG